MRSAAAILCVLLLVTGCQFAPRHIRPALPTAPEYPAEYSRDSIPGARASTIGWRDFLRDPRLEALVTAALTRNRDLVIAVAQIEEARGFYRIQNAERLPVIVAGADATRSRVPASSAGAPPGAGAVTIDRYSIGVGVSAFELDFWGRVRNLSEAARSQFLSTVQAQRAFRLSLIREVAGTYLAAVEAAERIRLAEATVESRREGVRIAEVRFTAGITSALEFRQAESLLPQAEAELAALRLTRARAENALAVLVGGPVAVPLPDALPLSQQLNGLTLAAGLPSELLIARPDIIAAEERLRAASANIGAARAAFFPSIALTGDIGFVSPELSKLVGSDNRTWSYGPSISLPIFNLGGKRGNLTVAQARKNIAVASYELAIQIAFEEVADALAGRRYLADQVAAQSRGTAAAREIAELARLRYNEGVVRFLEVLDAERNLFAAEQALLQLRRAEVENLVTLYIALGGGGIDQN